MKFVFAMLAALVISQMALADMITGDSTMEEGVVIDESWFPSLGESDPLFGGQPGQRDIARIKTDFNSTTSEWQGQLSVLKEIPYSYPQMTHRSLAAKVLAEMESKNN